MLVIKLIKIIFGILCIPAFVPVLAILVLIAMVRDARKVPFKDEDIKDIVETVFKPILEEELKLYAYVKIEYKENTTGTARGACAEVMADIYNIKIYRNRDLKSIIRTLAHEYRHVWQHTYNRNILKDYIDSDVDHDAYFKHPSEVDAREYANKFIASKRIKKLIEECSKTSMNK